MIDPETILTAIMLAVTGIAVLWAGLALLRAYWTLRGL